MHMDSSIAKFTKYDGIVSLMHCQESYFRYRFFLWFLDFGTLQIESFANAKISFIVEM